MPAVFDGSFDCPESLLIVHLFEFAHIVGASLSEPHTSETALYICVCIRRVYYLWYTYVRTYVLAAVYR